MTTITSYLKAEIDELLAALQQLAAPIPLSSLYQPADNNDYGITLNRALPYATGLGKAILIDGMYRVATTVALKSSDALVGLGPRTGLVAPTNVAMPILTASNASNVHLSNFAVNGNCLNTEVKARSISFQLSAQITLDRITTLYNPDWACTFDRCSNVTVTDYVHDAGAAVQFGGRDGIHFLDCSDVLLDGARIHSGDDCVGITSETRDIARITIRNVTGVSQIAAVVTVGNEGPTSYNATNITIENISTYSSPNWTSNSGHTNYVVKVRAQNNSYVRRLRISNITGDASQYGLWLDGNSNVTDPISDVQISSVNVVSDIAHGIFLSRVTHFEMHACFGRSTSGSFDGLNFSVCSFGSLLGCSTRSSALWGLQLNGCTSIDVTSFMARDCGQVNFASNNGGNGRIVNCADVQIIGGQFVGLATISYYGLSQSGNTSTSVSTMTRTGGAH